MIKRLLFIRHGESTANAAQVYAGSRPDIQLTELGRKQAEAAGVELRSDAVDVIIASPLDRAQDTAKIIAGLIGYDAQLIVTDARLHEIDVGHLAGQHDEGFVLGYAHLASGDDDTAESPDEVIERVTSFLGEVLPKYDDKTVLIVAHAGVARTFQAILEGVTLQSLAETTIPNAEAFDLPLEKLQEAEA